MLAAVATLVVQATVWTDPLLGTVDPEEGLTAAQAVLGTWAGVGPATLFQYKAFCTGCTVDAALGSALFSVAGPGLIAWKLVPALFAAVAVATICGVLVRRLGRGAAWTVVAACLLVPPVVFEGGARGFGNHYEAGWLAVALLVATSAASSLPAAVAVGAAAGLLAAMTLSASWVLLALPVGLLASGRHRAAAGFLLGASVTFGGWLIVGGGLGIVASLQTYARTLPVPIGGLDASTPLDRAWAVLYALSPFQAGDSLVLGGFAAAAAVTALFGLGWRPRPVDRLVLAGWGALATMLTLAPVQLPDVSLGAYGARYAIGATQLAALTVGLAVARTRPIRPLLAGLVLAAWGLSGVVERVHLAASGTPSHLATGEVAPWFQVRRTLLVRRGADADPWACGANAVCVYHDGFRRGRAWASSRCRWGEAPGDVSTAFGTGWGHGVAHGLGACVSSPSVCERWEAVVALLPVSDPATLLAAATGVGDSGSDARSCDGVPALAGVLAAVAPVVLPVRLPAWLATAEARTAWARLTGFQLASRLGRPWVGQGASLTDDVREALSVSEGVGAWAMPDIDLGLGGTLSPLAAGSGEGDAGPH